MKIYVSLKKTWLIYLVCLILFYIFLFLFLKNQTDNYNYHSNINLLGFAFPNDAQSIRLTPYEDTYSSFSETLGGIYLFPTGFAYKRFSYEH